MCYGRGDTSPVYSENLARGVMGRKKRVKECFLSFPSHQSPCSPDSACRAPVFSLHEGDSFIRCDGACLSCAPEGLVRALCSLNGSAPDQQRIITKFRIKACFKKLSSLAHSFWISTEHVRLENAPF